MINAAICDDEKFFVDELHKHVGRIFLENKTDAKITDYASGKALSERAGELDLIFLDVRMNELDGFETAEILRKNGFSGCLIFVTVMKDDVYKAFDYGAFDYLVKPLSEKSFRHTMERYFRSLDNEKTLVITRKNEQLMIKTAEILYCEIINRKIDLRLLNGNVIEYYCRITELESKLGNDFFRSHRSYLVNLKHISSCNSSEITLSDGSKIPLARSRRADLMSALMDDMGGVK